MTKSSSKSQRRSKSPNGSKIKNRGTPHNGSGMTKHDHVLGLLRAIAAISKATGWQPHSVRGFLTGVVKKKLGLALISEKTKSGRVYRTHVAKPSAPSRSASVQQERNDA
jgi:hypothetical protein